MATFCFAVIFFAVAFASIAFAKGDGGAVVSPGLYVLAEQNSMAKAGLLGSSIKFEAADFARSLNLPVSKLESITVTKAPPVSDGELLVGATVLNAGQTISVSNLGLLSYSAKPEIRVSSFSFRVGDSPLELTCKLYMLDKVNSAPTLRVATDESLAVSTHSNMTLHGRLPSYDPDGDEVTIEIVSYPKSGILYLADRRTGEYTYTPSEKATGKDSFTYVARDKYGNYSASATVSLTIVKPSVSVTYADMKDSPIANAAMTMTEKGIMGGTQIGSNLYFYPENTVTRAEFVVMAMNAIGVKATGLSAGDCSAFADCEDIPEEMRGYIAAACRMNYVEGTLKNGRLYFEPLREITRAEAAVILGKMIDAELPTAAMRQSFDDAEEIPVWAEASVYSLSYKGILQADNGNIEPMSAATRGDVAIMLEKVVNN
jgi:hypothetical protein